MNRFVVAVAFATITLAGTAGPAFAQQTQPTADTAAAVQAAQTAGEAWLSLFGEGKGKETWEQASKHFQAAVPENAWVQQVAALRTQLGTFGNRTLQEARYATDVPNAPNAWKVFRSAWIPAPPPLSLPAMVRAMGSIDLLRYR